MRPAIILLASLAAVAALAWALTALSASDMGSMMMARTVNSGPEGVASFLVTWSIMMVAMMLPASAPVAQAFVTLCVEKGSRDRWVAPHTIVFLSSYVLVWTLFGVAIAGLYVLLFGRVEELAMSGTLGPAIAGVLLVAAGLYQLTGLKRLCLDHCRSPLELILTRFRPGVRGALSLGLRHAAYCLGCCWAMFVVLFAVGMMSVPWMALLSVIIFVEKLTPKTSRASEAFGLLFVALGAVFAAAPALGAAAMGI